MQNILKDWRQDAMHKHQYESAIFIGDKVLAITSQLPYPSGAGGRTKHSYRRS